MADEHDERRRTGEPAFPIPARRAGVPARSPRPAPPIGYDARQDPTAIYLAGLGTEQSRAGMVSALRQAARLLGRGTPAEARWHELDYSEMTLLRALLSDRDYAPATANKVLAAVRGTLLAAWKLGLMDGEQYRRATSIKPVRGKRLLKGRALEQGEIEALFAQLDGSHPGDARDGALLALLYGCGLRRTEAAKIETADVDCVEPTIRIQGKGNRERQAHMNRGTHNAITNWLEHRGPEPGPLLLQVSRHGLIGHQGLSADAIRLRLKRLAHSGGVPHCTPHDLRRTYVSRLLEQGADISTVSRLAGHQNVQTTTRYDRRGERAARAATEALHVPEIRRRGPTTEGTTAHDADSQAVSGRGRDTRNPERQHGNH